MDKQDEIAYRAARPYLKGIIALVFYLRFGPKLGNESRPIQSFFVEADMWLLAFEQEGLR